MASLRFLEKTTRFRAGNRAKDAYDTPLVHAARCNRAADVVALLADGADVNEPNTTGGRFGSPGTTALHVACTYGYNAVVTALLAANADVNLARSSSTPLIIACERGHTEVAANLLAANANVDQATNTGYTPMSLACHFGYLGCVQLLSSYGAVRTFPDDHAPYNTAELIATLRGHHAVAAWLLRSRHWLTALHHLEVLAAERVHALLREADSGSIVLHICNDGGPTPLALAQALAAAGGAAEGTAAFLVLEAAKPWSRKTHKYFPAPARVRPSG